MDNDGERRTKVRIRNALMKELETRNLSDYEDGNMDPSAEVHPIGHFIDDREEMIEQMFSVLHGDQIRRLLPYELKGMSIEELKADCLVHLLGMSKKRIFAILQGKELVDSSSDSESDTSGVISIPDETPEEKDKSTNLREKVNSTKIISTSEKEKTPKKKEKRKKKEHKKKSKKKKSKKSDSDKKSLSRRKIVNLRAELQLTKNKKESFEKNTIEISDSDEEEDKEDSEDEDVTIVETSKKGTSLLELLELEMRARAIKAALMIDKEGTVNSILDMNNPVTIKQEKVEPVKRVDENKLKEIKNTICKQVDEDILLIEDVDIVELDNSDEEDVKVNDKIETEKLMEGKSGTDEITSNEDSNSNSEWSERWLQSKDVQNVVSKNKMCANLRRRMRFARLMKQKELEEKEKSENQTNAVEANVNIEGSVEEYLALSSKSDNGQTEENNEKTDEKSSEDDSEKHIENETINLQEAVEDSKSTWVENPDSNSPVHGNDVINMREDDVCQDNVFLDPVIEESSSEIKNCGDTDAASSSPDHGSDEPNMIDVCLDLDAVNIVPDSTAQVEDTVN